MTNKELIQQYRKWLDESFTLDYVGENGERLPFYPFYTWVEFFTEYDPAFIRDRRGYRAILFREYRIWCIENGYQYQHPKTLGIERLV